MRTPTFDLSEDPFRGIVRPPVFDRCSVGRSIDACGRAVRGA